MKSLIDIVNGCDAKRTGAPGSGDTPHAKGQTDPAVVHVRRLAEKGLWQDVEFVPKIVEKIGG